MKSFRISVGDRRTPLFTVVSKNGSAMSLAGLTVQFQMVDADGADVVAATSTGVTVHPTFTFAASATTDRLTANEHALVVGDQVILASTGTLPAGLSAGVRYYVVDVEPNSFRVSLSPSGPVVNVTDSGTGTHSAYIVGGVSFAFAANDVDTAGRFTGYFLVTGGGLTDTFPVSGIPIEVVSR